MRSGFRTSWRFSVMRANRSAGVITAIVTELGVREDKYSRRWMVMNESIYRCQGLFFFPLPLSQPPAAWLIRSENAGWPEDDSAPPIMNSHCRRSRSAEDEKENEGCCVGLDCIVCVITLQEM